MVSEQVLQEAVRRLVEGFHPAAIILFGSQARGTADERSDVDLLVLCDPPADHWALTLAMDRALWGLGLARDLVVLTPAEYRRLREVPGTVARYAAREGRVLYGRAA